MSAVGWGLGLVLAWGVAGCDDLPDPATGARVSGLPTGRTTPELGLDQGGGAPPWRLLDHLDTAEISLPRVEARDATTGVFRLDGPWDPALQRVGRLHLYTTPLPFHTDMPRPNYAPYGARLLRAGRPLPYVNDVGDIKGGGWFVQDDVLQVFALESPERWPKPPELASDELAALDRLRQWDGEAAPETFVRKEVTLGPLTQPGVHLPVGGTARFSVDVPAGATLEWGVAPLPDPLRRAAVPARAVVRVDGQLLGDDPVPADAVTPKRASLATWAGKRVTIELAAEAIANGEPGGHAVFTAPVVRRPAAGGPRHVVLVGIDTLRWDALGTHGAAADRSPELDAWAEQSVVFDQAWAPAPRTRPSFRTALTGRWPIAAATAPTVAEHLAPRGFRTAGFVANVHLVPRFGFHDGFEEWHYENGARAQDQVDRALAWLRDHEDEDTFVFLHLMDPHTWYNAPEPYGSRFQVGARPDLVPDHFDRWQIYQLMRRPKFGAAEKKWVRGAYEGEVAYLSAELSRFLGALDGLGGKTLTMIHSDHGEELWDHGAYEHNHTLYEELVHALLWVRTPGGWAGGPHRIQSPVGLVDMVPTLLDLVGVPAPATDGTSLRPLLDPARESDRADLAAALQARPLQLGHLMFDKERWGVVFEGAKYVLHTASGREELYDLAADPREQHDLAPKADVARLERMRAALGKAMGWPVGPGWRLRLQGRPPAFDVVFDAPVPRVGVLDPEAEREARANLEWGEQPPTPIDAVGTFALSEDGRRAHFKPGPKAAGHLLWIGCDGPCPSARVEVGGARTKLDVGLVTAGAVRLEARAGTVLAVPPPESVAGPVDPAQLQALEQLGYVEGD